MSDETKQEGANQQPDLLNNFKKEIDRKFGNFESQVAELTKTNQALIAQLAASQPKRVEPKEEDISSLIYDNPKLYGEKIKETAKNELREELALSNKAQAKTNAILNQLVYDYPELQNESDALTKRATAIYMGLDAEDKASPMAYKLAVKEAATELGVVPRAKRNQEDDNYSVSSSSSTSNRPSKQSKSKLAAETVAFAKLLGRPVDDPKYIERLEKAQRDNWTKYR